MNFPGNFDCMHFTESSWDFLSVGNGIVSIRILSGLILLPGHPARLLFGSESPPATLTFRNVAKMLCEKSFYSNSMRDSFSGSKSRIESRWDVVNREEIQSFYVEGVLMSDNSWCDLSIDAEKYDLEIE